MNQQQAPIGAVIARWQLLFLFKNFKEQIIAKTNSFVYDLLVFVFATVGANLLKARMARDSSP